MTAQPETLTLLTYKDNPRCMGIRLLAAYAGVNLSEPPFKFGKEGSENKAPAFIRNAHPLGKVPVLETKDGYIFESMAIFRHIARLGADKGLYGKTPYETSQVDQWIEFSSQELSPSVTGWLGRLMGKLPKNKELTEKAIAYTKECFAGMDIWLETRTFFVGERLTAADIILVSTILPLFQLVLTPDFVRPYVNLWRWFTLCINQPLFMKELEPGKLLEGVKDKSTD